VGRSEIMLESKDGFENKGRNTTLARPRHVSEVDLQFTASSLYLRGGRRDIALKAITQPSSSSEMIGWMESKRERGRGGGWGVRRRLYLGRKSFCASSSVSASFSFPCDFSRQAACKGIHICEA